MSDSEPHERRDPAVVSAALVANANIVARSAEAILSVDMSDIRIQSRTPQVILGLCRAAFAQSKAVAALALAGMLSAAAPNQRLVIEIALRMQWLEGMTVDERRTVVDTMLAKDRDDTNRLLAYLEDAGHRSDFDASDMDSFELDALAKGDLHQQATRLTAAVSATKMEPWSIFASWLAETPFAHASANLAGKYAPTLDGIHMVSGTPEPSDLDLELHRLIQTHIVVLTAALLTAEGFPRGAATRIPSVFFAI